MDAKIDICVVPWMNVAATIAELSPSQASLNASSRHDDRSDAMLASFVIENIAGTKLDQTEESRSVDRVRFIACCDKGADRQPREVVAGKEAFIPQIAVDVEVRLRHSAFIQ